MSALHDDPRRLDLRVRELRVGLREKAEPVALASRSGADYHADKGTGEFHLSLFGRPIRVTFPEFVVFEADGREANLAIQALLAYHFTLCDGAPLAGQWKSFGELPDGRFYNQAYQGYTGKELARAFGEDLAAFVRAAEKSGGQRAALGDAAFIFLALPRVPLLVVYHLGDEDFPSTCQILFDGSVSHYLPTDVCAILGSMLARKMLVSQRE